MISIEYKDPKAKEISETDIRSYISEALSKLGLTSDQDIEIMWVPESEMRNLNSAHRGIDSSTDVLSFPQAKTPNTEASILGSIVLSLDKINEKNEKPRDVIVHGLLHLLGYDHEQDEQGWEKVAKLTGCEL